MTEHNYLECDQCGKRVLTKEEIERHGWLHLDRYMSIASYGEEVWRHRDFCSLECLRAWV